MPWCLHREQRDELRGVVVDHRIVKVGKDLSDHPVLLLVGLLGIRLKEPEYFVYFGVRLYI